MALILPKGIIINSPQVMGDIERIDGSPLDDAEIAKFWKVYTTTQRRLLDPTAERLENLWWRIWGSRKKNLNGKTVARLFAQISDGETFVPLRGPPNRHEGSPPLTTGSRLGSGASSTNNIQRPSHSRPSTTSSSAASRAPGPMPHPILKKTRGPSTTGPRPTARFISPHESPDEGSESPNTHVVVQPPSPSPESQDAKTDKKIAAVQIKKTFVASAKKKRPIIMRRQSSQTSQSSAEIAAAARASDSGQSSAIQSSSERTPPTFTEQARGKGQTKFQENFSPSIEKSGGSAQSSKKRVSRSADSKRPAQRKSASKSTDTPPETALSSEPGPSTQLRRIENLQEEEGLDFAELTAEEVEELELQRMLLEEANARVRKQSQTTHATQTRTLPEAANDGRRASRGSKSNTAHGAEGLGAMGFLQYEAKGTSSAAPTLTAASGQLNLGSVGHEESQASDAGLSSKLHKGKGRDPNELQRVAMFAKRPVPPVQVAASPDASGPLSRSKSQLTLLLEKDRERSSGKKSDKDQSQGKKK